MCSECGYVNPSPDPPFSPDPGERETEFSLGWILGIDVATWKYYGYDHPNALNVGQYLGYQANVGLSSGEHTECRA